MLDRSAYANQEAFPGSIEARFARAVADLFDLFRPDIPPEDSGGVLIVSLNEREHVALVGCFSKYPAVGCYRIAHEKLHRTRRMRRLYGHTSAWLSRNPDRKKFAGCIVIADNFLVSFSGLSEHWDETLLSTAAWLCGLFTAGEVDHIASISSNPHIPLAMKRLHHESPVP